jgi:hypothetical protein
MRKLARVRLLGERGGEAVQVIAVISAPRARRNRRPKEPSAR